MSPVDAVVQVPPQPVQIDQAAKLAWIRRNLPYIIAFATAFAAAIIVVKWPHRIPEPIPFRAFSAADFTQQVTPLFLVAVLIERGLEIFISTWRDPGAVKLQRTVDKASQRAAIDPAKVSEVQSAQDALSTYKAFTKQVAMPLALGMGIFISAVGIRCLGNLVSETAFAAHPNQKALFEICDIAFTGALLGGGSDFVHQFITTITNFLNQGKS